MASTQDGDKRRRTLDNPIPAIFVWHGNPMYVLLNLAVQIG